MITNASFMQGGFPNLAYPRSVMRTRFLRQYSKRLAAVFGIAPDVIIPLPMERKLTDNIDEWVLWVAEDMKK